MVRNHAAVKLSVFLVFLISPSGLEQRRTVSQWENNDIILTSLCYQGTSIILHEIHCCRVWAGPNIFHHSTCWNLVFYIAAGGVLGDKDLISPLLFRTLQHEPSLKCGLSHLFSCVRRIKTWTINKSSSSSSSIFSKKHINNWTQYLPTKFEKQQKVQRPGGGLLLVTGGSRSLAELCTPKNCQILHVPGPFNDLQVPWCLELSSEDGWGDFFFPLKWRAQWETRFGGGGLST